MGLKKFISGLFRPQGKGYQQFVSSWMSKQPQYMGDNYRDLALGGYSRNETVYACIKYLMNGVSEAPLRVYTADRKELPAHGLRQLVRKPNPFITETELWGLTVLHLCLAGNAVWEKIRSASGRWVETWPLRPDRVRVVPDKDKWISHYLYEIDGVAYPIKVEDIIHFKTPDPLNDYFGMAPLRSAVRNTSIDNESADFVKMMLQNGGFPGLILKVEGAKDSPELVKRMKAQFIQNFGGDHKGAPGVIDKDSMDIISVGLNLEQLAFPELRGDVVAKICQVFGVNPILIGAKVGLNASTYSNFEEARSAGQEATIAPLQRHFSDVLDRYGVPEFGDETNEARFDTSDVSALKSVRKAKYEAMTPAVTAGYVTVNDARKFVGLDTIDPGDVFLRGFTVVEVPADGKAPEPAPVAPVVADPNAKAACGCGHDHKAANEKQTKQLQAITTRMAVAKKFSDKYKAIAQNEFSTQAQEIMLIFNRTAKAVDPVTMEEIKNEVTRKKSFWTTRTAAEVLPISAALLKEAAKMAAVEIGIEFDMTSEAAVAFIKDYTYKFAQKISETSVENVRTAIDMAIKEGFSVNETKGKLVELFQNWSEVRSEMVARSEVIRAANMGAKMSYKEAGIKELKWLASAGACDDCADLNGTTVGIDDTFYDLGEQTPLGAKINYEAIETPPLHPQCECGIVPA